MKIVRRELDLRSAIYSREFGVERSIGCHLMEVVNRIEASMSPKVRADQDEAMRERFFTAGYLWEHVMSRPERLEHAFSVEAVRMELLVHPDLVFPGEMMFCVDCDAIYQGGEIGRDHCKTRNHHGIFFTIDALNHARMRIREWKFTWMSSDRTGSTHMDGIWKWPVQNMFYSWGYGVMGGELQACFAVGNYERRTRTEIEQTSEYEPPFPKVFEFDLDYSEQELNNNARMIISHARKWEMV